MSVADEQAEGTQQAEASAEPAVVAGLGDPRVDAAVERLSDIDEASLDEQPSIYEDVLNRLKGALDDSAR